MTADSKHHIEQLKAAGRIVRTAFERMKAAAVPGITTAKLDAIAALVFAPDADVRPSESWSRSSNRRLS